MLGGGYPILRWVNYEARLFRSEMALGLNVSADYADYAL
jgi:hypothetical protein